ncbi:amidohydrolase [Rhizobium sp. BK251]|uniref:amidohydrolase family protein n=1 Tax=Rhizobium sp. BK251 TaxID=2512125 RepID=UPI0010437C02|nr:amidohydrolase [Rhizobium sp. BK251]TCL71443.1 putative TIM-barrel fold metal-dependent hydrolase [Rhizobium sp. BK251]
MLIDTHLHLIDKTKLTYPWLSGVPALDRDFLYATYATEARRCGIDGALHMEVDVGTGDIQNETENVRALSRQEDSLLLGAIAACRPEDVGFADYLERQTADSFVKGFRRVLHVMPDELSEGALFRENIAKMAGSGLTFDLCVLPHQVGKAIALADLAPNVQFILDHCGVPAISANAYEPWQEGILEIAKRANVACKISGIVAYADAGTWDVETLRPYVEQVTQSFGWDRLVWGSDWPVCTLGGGLSTWVATTHALFAGSSETERTKLFSGNARKLWKL